MKFPFRNPLGERPWLLIFAAFLLLISAWAFLIWISRVNQPEHIPLDPPPRQSESP